MQIISLKRINFYNYEDLLYIKENYDKTKLEYI